MADSDGEIEQAPTPDAALYEATLGSEFLVFYDSYESGSQIQHQKPHIPVRRESVHQEISSISQAPSPRLDLECAPVKLQDLVQYLCQTLVSTMHSQQTLMNLVKQHIREWCPEDITVWMTCGQSTMPSIPIRVSEFVPEDEALLMQIQYKEGTEIRKRSPALGIQQIGLLERSTFSKYVSDIVDHHLDAFNRLCWADEEHDFPPNLFALLVTAPLRDGNETYLVRESLRLVVVTFIMGHTLTIDEGKKAETLSHMRSYNSQNANAEDYISSRLTNRQLKYCFSDLQQSILANVLGGLQKMLDSSRLHESWLVAFIIVLYISMAQEDYQQTIHLIQNTSSVTENTCSRSAQKLAESACGTIDDGIQVLHEKVLSQYRNLGDSDSALFLQKVISLVEENYDFLQQRSQVHISYENCRMYPARLTARLLLRLLPC